MQFFAQLNEQLSSGHRQGAGAEVVAELLPAGDFWVAEGFHQHYLERGGGSGQPQSAAKGCSDRIRCYG